MSDLRTEEEQVELIKKWWADNGKSTIAIIVLTLAGILGWQWWQQQEQAKAEAASSSYEQLIELMNQPELNDEQRSTATHLASELKKNYEGSLYAEYAGLFEAKLLFQKGELDQALSVLKSVQATATHPTVKEAAGLRQAQLLWQQGKTAEALSIAKSIKAQVFSGELEELKGDLLVESGDKDAAKEAYLKARTIFSNKGVSRPVLEMKLADLGGA